MLTVAQVARALQSVLTQSAERLGRETQFVQRAGKLDGASFSQILTFGWLSDPQSSLEALSQTAAALGVAISPQGLDERFSETAANCLRRILEAAMGVVVESSPQVIPILQRFTGIFVQDSTSLLLPAELSELWKGCGGSKGGEAALKLQVRLDLLKGGLQLELQDGCASDRSATFQHAPLPVGALRLADLGYFDLAVLAETQQQHAYWLTRPQAGTRVFDPQGQALDLAAYLASQTSTSVDVPIQLGATQHLPCRLLAVRVCQETADRRRQHLHTDARRRGQAVSQERLRLADWTIFVTNVPTERLSLRDALVIARTRWQIELLFKLWKDHAKLDESRSQKPWRILCEIYAKLLGQLIQHWLCLASCWRFADHSLRKAAVTIQRHALHLAVAFAHRSPKRLSEAISVIQATLAAGARINKRQDTPHTYQLLLDLESLA
jgi:hypothetical protein